MLVGVCHGVDQPTNGVSRIQQEILLRVSLDLDPSLPIDVCGRLGHENRL